MILRNIDFGNVINASGARNFFGQGYPFHSVFKHFGLTYRGSTFAAKTTTFKERMNPGSKEGNMRLRADRLTPVRLLPRCIKVYPLKGIVLNAVGLSGPGATWLLNQKIWQAFTEPFFISFMSVEGSKDGRLNELGQFVDLLKGYLGGFQAPFGLKINFSCPNVGLELEKLIDETGESLDIASVLNIPLVGKYNLELPPKTAVQLAKNKAMDALCMSNAVPFGKLDDKIDWNKLFPSGVSPLADLGGGGLSGKPLLFPLIDWLMEARQSGLEKSIIAGGGILSKFDAKRVIDAATSFGKFPNSAVSLGSISILRFWRVQRIIDYINTYYRPWCSS